jgi:hypothetical protein
MPSIITFLPKSTPVRHVLPPKSSPVYYVPWRRLRAEALQDIITEIERCAYKGRYWPELGEMRRRLADLQNPPVIIE